MEQRIAGKIDRLTRGQASEAAAAALTAIASQKLPAAPTATASQQPAAPTATG